jgi:endonuclease/exonuclease/phosphatase family metal-dependent hydrolase
MKIMSWNIWKGKFLDKVIAQIEQETPDVVCLQEVIEQEIDGQRVNSAQRIASKLGYEFVYCKAFTTDRHTPVFDIGDAILSKVPILSSSCHFLSTLEEYQGSAVSEPRTAVKVEVKTSTGTVSIITCHLGYSEKFQETDIRNTQLDRLLSLIPKTSAILTGDFNSQPDSRTLRILNNSLTNTDRDQTEYSYTDMKEENHPEYRIDYIFTTADVASKDFQILPTDASDHSPLTVEITI